LKNRMRRSESGKMETKIGRISVWILLAVNVCLLIGLIVGVGELKAQNQDVREMKDAQIKTMVTVAVACRNIEIMSERMTRLEQELNEHVQGDRRKK
jgi:hypothetical protein